MNDLKKRLAALAVAGFMIGTTGCSKNENSIKYEVNSETNQSELVSTVPIIDLAKYYIIVIDENEGKEKFYLTYENIVYNKFNGYVSEFKEVGTNDIIINQSKGVKKGKLKNMLKFIQFVPTYSTYKDEYTIDEIKIIFDKIIKDYSSVKENGKVKKYVIG